MPSALDHFLAKSKVPFSKADVEEFLQLYSSVTHMIVERHPNGQIAAFALLTPPMRLFGSTRSMILAAGTDGTVDARAMFRKMTDEARRLGAEVLVGGTYRNPRAMMRMFGGEPDGWNIRWPLKETHNA